MGEGADRETSALEAELSRLVALRDRLEGALEAADADRAALRHEVRVLEARAARLHDELAEAHRRQAGLHDELDDLYRRQLGDSQPPVEAAEEGESETEADAVPAEAGEAAEEKGQEAEEQQPTPLRAAPAPTAIEVRDLRKSFVLPSHQMETLKERALHPLRSRARQQLTALDGISFDVAEGEFLGIAGPNGSGKSTLLKLLASVYAADGGSVRIAGRLAPFIELGVGLNPELAAYDNVVVSGVMMGLTPERARDLYPQVIEFAGLEAFTKVKLKNYSSGMRVRLAFSVMANVDADILLIDEVLAVGDAEFREKCLERLEGLRDDGKTIVFVTHAMDTMKAHCDRAILLHGGRIAREGAPDEIAAAYLETATTPSEAGPVLRAVER